MIQLVLVLLLTVSSFGVHGGNPVPAPPQLAAKAYLLVDAVSGELQGSLAEGELFQAVIDVQNQARGLERA